MGGTGNCAVIGCTQNTKKISNWKESICETHDQPHNNYPCNQPYTLYCFPSKNSYRVKWIEAMRRVNAEKSVWKPCQSDRVCSVHFVDGVPTEQNPYPTWQLGYEITVSTRRNIIYHAYTPKWKKQLQDQPFSATSAVASTTDLPDIFLADHGHEGYCLPPNKSPCPACKDKDALIKSLQIKMKSLKLRSTRQGQYFSWKKLKRTRRWSFYTGLSTISTFSVLFSLIHPNLSNMQYWRGTRRHILKSNRKRKFTRSSRKILSYKDEFLLTMMKLRLGLLNEDLADRFPICSSTFTTWIRLLRSLLGDALVKWIPREAIRDNLPKVFKDTNHSTRNNNAATLLLVSDIPAIQSQCADLITSSFFMMQIQTLWGGSLILSEGRQSALSKQ